MGVAVAVIAAIGIVLMFLLTQATSNRELYERNYGRLFVINMVVAGVLLLVILWVAVRLVSRLRKGKFGSRLLVKLAAIFALVGFVPGMLIYVVSYQFVSRSIESWFDVKVEGALDAGLSLGRATLDTLANDLANKTRAAAAQLADTPDTSAPPGPGASARAAVRERRGAVERQPASSSPAPGSRASSSTRSGRRPSSCATCAPNAPWRSSRDWTSPA